ncbi:MAG: hypothetical protein IJ690_04360 [Clostridia bacterium]|nr:hypothetical protein [Clostridia bacterium]
MLKFKMSLLLKNAKFRVAVIVLMIAAITAGIVFIPRNKATEVSQYVNIKANSSGASVGGMAINVIEKDGNATGYDNIFCVQEEANLSYKTYGNPIDIPDAGKYFNNFKSARWLINNMYISTVRGEGGINNNTAKNVQLINLANLLTSDTVKTKVAAKGFDTSSVTPQKIFALKDKKIGTTYSKNAIELVEQIALWKYTKNAGTTISATYDKNPNQYLDGANLSADEQKTLKYMYYALTVLADSNSSTSNSITNVVTLNKNNAKFDESTYKVGPYYIESNGVKLTSYSFGSVDKAQYPITVTITKNDGSTENKNQAVVEKNNDGSFYIKLDGYKNNVKKVSFKIDSITSKIYTQAYVVDGGDKQNLMGVEKTVKATSLTDSKDITITPPGGSYNVVLKKVKKDGTTVITESPATFKVNGTEKNTENGILNIENNKKIENTNQTDTYEVVETKAPEGYKAFEGTMKVNVKFKEVNKKYLIDSDNTTSEGFTNGAKVDVSSENATITITVPNEELPKPGQYSVELYKVDYKGNTVVTPAKFEVNGKEATTQNGKITVASNVQVNDDTTVGKYTIKETGAPENYELYNGTISLDVKMTKVDNTYVLKEDGITFKYSPVENGMNAAPTFKLDGSTIKIYVPNREKEFDLALRKFISKIDGEDVTPSREPIINEQSIINLQQTGTASYYHIKDSIGVTIGSEVEYTIRVYNEGEILGFAKSITDYIPDGLTFVKIADESAKLYTTTAKEGDKVIVLNYNGNTVIQTLRDFFGQKDFKVTDKYYQEVKIICRVNDTDKTYITSRAEITNYGYSEKDAEGNVVWKEATAIGNVDRDSVQDTIKNNLDLDNWYVNARERTYVDSNGKTVVDSKYYPGVQDDDDFETVELLTGKYSIVIKKVDAADKKTTLPGAYFSVKGSDIDKEVGPTGANGEVTVVNGVQFKDEKEQYLYTIKETKAPENYKLYDGDITVKVAAKYNGKSFVIDGDRVKVDGKDVEYSLNNEKTTLTILVPDVQKEFDLSLRKFITEVNGKELAESREPKVDLSKLISGESTTATYNHSKEPVDVNPTDIVTYTIRVYNEGEMDGYAAEVMDDIPEGLEFLPDHEINKEYKWVLNKETNSISTDYLSMKNGKDNLIKAFDASSKKLDYKDLKVAFKVVEPETSDRILINHAQITEDTDSNGNSVDDRDSTTNEWIDGEDDQDIDKVKVRYFDLALRKWVTKAIVYENGYEKVTETNHDAWDDPEPVVKVDLKNTNIDNVEVKFEYSIRIINQGEIAGYAKEISDYIPEGLKFVPADNPQWKEVDGKVVTDALADTLLQPGETAEVKILLTWINGANNLGLKTNVAEISKDFNEFGSKDIDSTPNNKVPGEDDIDDAPVILAIRTGAPIVYTGVAIAVLAIVSLGVVIIRRKVLTK